LTYYKQEQLCQKAPGNEAAFSQLLHKHRERINTMHYTIGKSSVMAEEIVPYVFLEIWQRQETIPDIQNFYACLFMIARNDVCKALEGKANG
jgi:DNA-directed RNA polymerase specialized sigma24 family protein